MLRQSRKPTNRPQFVTGSVPPPGGAIHEIKRKVHEQAPLVRVFSWIVLNILITSSIVSAMDRQQLFDLQPDLIGELIEVRPLRPEDWESLFAVASDPLIWEQHPASDRYQETVFREFFREALESRGALIVIDRQTQAVIGSSRYFGFDPEKSEVEIGWTFLARSHWGGKYNGELKKLMLDHAFRFVESVIFVIGETNFRSQKAVEKIGGVQIGRRCKTDSHGNTVENVVYQIRESATAPGCSTKNTNK